jgi:hypothetical protein
VGHHGDGPSGSTASSASAPWRGERGAGGLVLAVDRLGGLARRRPIRSRAASARARHALDRPAEVARGRPRAAISAAARSSASARVGARPPSRARRRRRRRSAARRGPRAA